MNSKESKVSSADIHKLLKSELIEYLCEFGSNKLLNLFSIEVLKKSANKAGYTEIAENSTKEDLVEILNEEDLRVVLETINLDELRKVVKVILQEE